MRKALCSLLIIAGIGFNEMANTQESDYLLEETEPETYIYVDCGDGRRHTVIYSMECQYISLECRLAYTDRMQYVISCNNLHDPHKSP